MKEGTYHSPVLIVYQSAEYQIAQILFKTINFPASTSRTYVSSGLLVVLNAMHKAKNGSTHTRSHLPYSANWCS